MRDKYNLNTLPASAMDVDDIAGNASGGPSGEGEVSNSVPMIPGMAPEDRVEIPGMSNNDFSRVPPPPNVTSSASSYDQEYHGGGRNSKKTPYSKPIPKNFQNSWNDVSAPPPPQQQGPPPMAPPGPQDPGCISLAELQRQATAVVAFGNVYPVLPGSNLFMSITNGEMAVKECLRSELLM